MATSRVLWYFADPMCSWCWGFTPVMHAIKSTYGEHLKIALLLGGLRPGETRPMTSDARAEILHHWRAVHARTGQPFRFEGAMPEGFVYDTEPACRAVLAVGALEPDEVFAYFTSVQAAFYAEQRDVTREDVLADLAQSHAVDAPAFIERFRSEEMKTNTRTHFQMTRQAGVHGFPTAVMQTHGGGALLTHGYRPFEELKPAIDAWLAQNE